jgi:hypothetical protein
LTLKALIVAFAFLYLVRHFVLHPLSMETWRETMNAVESSWWPFILAVLLMPVNWMLETLKWKRLASMNSKLTFVQALGGVLAGVTIGTATPNRVGEFAGRIYSAPEGDRKELLLLSFVSSFSQVMVTVMFGCLSVYFLGVDRWEQYKWPVAVMSFLIAISAILLFFRAYPSALKGRFAVLRNFDRREFLFAIILSALRYSVYVFQFCLLMMVLTGRAPDLELVFSVGVMYLLVTVLPTFSVTELIVRGSVAGSVIGANDVIAGKAVLVAGLLWSINVAIPSLAGIWFVLRLKFFRK